MGKKLQNKKKKNGMKISSTKNKNNTQHTVGSESEFEPVLADSPQPNPIESGDRISHLPDDLLRHIVSLITYDHNSECKGQTRILSTRWRDFWSRIAVEHEGGSIYVMLISTLRFVGSCLYCKEQYICPRKLVFHSHGSGRVLVATMGSCKKLHLDFSHGQDDDDDYYSDNWWASLWLMLSYLPCPLASILPPIRSLCLTSVNFPSNGTDAVSLLLLSIPSLYTLEMRECKGLGDIRVRWSRGMSRLRNLSIIDCQVNSIKIKSPWPSRSALRSIRYRGRCPSIMKFDNPHYIIGDPYIEDFMLELREGPRSIINDPDKCLLRISECIKTARYLTVCQWTFKAFIKSTLDSELYSLRELWWIDNSMDEENIESLITFLKELPCLEKLFVTIDPECYHLPRSRRRKRNRSKYRERRKLSCLNLVKMDGLEHEEDELLLAEEIFKITETEPAVVATTRRRCYARKLVRVDPDGPRMFVRETDRERINTKHRHMSV